MTTKNNDKNFNEIWSLFTEEVINRFGKNKHGMPNFSDFAKFNESQDIYKLEENDYKRVYNKLTIFYKRLNHGTMKVRPSSIKKIEGYYKILKDDYFNQELLDDEKPLHWFD